MSIIALITDFGLQDGYVGIMKGIIVGITPDATIIDISHDIPAQDIFSGALTLSRAWNYFPPQSIFCTVVDPGVGTGRRSIAVHYQNRYFVGPDNGLISFVLKKTAPQFDSCEAVLLENTGYWLSQISKSFHGRDIFAPVAAHLARGVPLANLGSPISPSSFFQLSIPPPSKTKNGLEGQIIHIDHFGNLATNLRMSDLLSSEFRIHLKNKTVSRIVPTFGDASPSELIALEDSDGWISICKVNGNASNYTGLNLFDSIHIEFP